MGEPPPLFEVCAIAKEAEHLIVFEKFKNPKIITSDRSDNFLDLLLHKYALLFAMLALFIFIRLLSGCCMLAFALVFTVTMCILERVVNH